jgi:hypothetical protein
MIRISGDGLGYLSTKEAYRDYRVMLEFKWGNHNAEWRRRNARDSGLFLHSTGPDGNSYDDKGAYKAAIECQIMQGSVGDLLLIKGKNESGKPIPVGFTAEVASMRDADGWFWWRKGGLETRIENTGRLNWFGKDARWKDVLDFRGESDVESPRGEWTQLECICAGDTITVKVNGTIVNHVTGATLNRGHILLQCEGSEIFFRKVELHPAAGPKAVD